ncbi:hypothetical protein [Bradyrhizobium sp. CCGUVB23]|uniref:hypothetical protein n=1 Tax=Bradyrhizobium sp. CCGUVB23 TaxID=2949630 RepID=UPI0020B314E8|nr:hypothetical protein [Bradyrhizobium sp. CCGUVB23]MCP3468682.1 hypothetical protein [Bradyrhizobium sp. CCGUVB23]
MTVVDTIEELRAELRDCLFTPRARRSRPNSPAFASAVRRSPPRRDIKSLLFLPYCGAGRVCSVEGVLDCRLA